MKRNLIALAALGLFAFGCGESPTSTNSETADLGATPEFARRGPLVSQVSVGSPDACEAFGAPTGCDANYSLVANEYADGSVTGEWTDQFGHGNGGFHATIDCLSVDGNEAWVSGVVTYPKDFAGLPVGARVADNGTSKNDPADQISFSFFGGDAPSCTEQPDYGLFDLTNGQVIVR